MKSRYKIHGPYNDPYKIILRLTLKWHRHDKYSLALFTTLEVYKFQFSRDNPWCSTCDAVSPWPRDSQLDKSLLEQTTSSHLLGVPSQSPGLGLLHVGSGVRETLEGQSPEGRHVLWVAGHEEQLAGALGPRHQAGVQAQLRPLVVTRRPVTASRGLNVKLWDRQTVTYHFILFITLPASWSWLAPAGFDSEVFSRTEKSTSVTVDGVIFTNMIKSLLDWNVCN